MAKIRQPIRSKKLDCFVDNLSCFPIDESFGIPRIPDYVQIAFFDYGQVKIVAQKEIFRYQGTWIEVNLS